MVLFLFVKDSTSYMFIALFGLIGISGLIKKVLPEYIRKRQRNNSLENSKDLISLGFFHSDIQKNLWIIADFVAFLCFTYLYYRLYNKTTTCFNGCFNVLCFSDDFNVIDDCF